VLWNWKNYSVSGGGLESAGVVLGSPSCPRTDVGSILFPHHCLCPYPSFRVRHEEMTEES